MLNRDLKILAPSREPWLQTGRCWVSAQVTEPHRLQRVATQFQGPRTEVTLPPWGHSCKPSPSPQNTRRADGQIPLDLLFQAQRGHGLVHWSWFGGLPDLPWGKLTDFLQSLLKMFPFLDYYLEDFNMVVISDLRVQDIWPGGFWCPLLKHDACWISRKSNNKALLALRSSRPSGVHQPPLKEGLWCYLWMWAQLYPDDTAPPPALVPSLPERWGSTSLEPVYDAKLAPLGPRSGFRSQT